MGRKSKHNLKHVSCRQSIKTLVTRVEDTERILALLRIVNRYAVTHTDRRKHEEPGC